MREVPYGWMMANSPVKAPHAAVAPPPSSDVAPLMSIAQITPAIQSSPTVTRPDAPGATPSLIPSLFVKSGQRRRRAIIVVSSVIAVFVAAFVGVMIFSQVR